MDNNSKIFQIAFKVLELKQNAVQRVIEGSKDGGVQRYYMRIPLESAHCNHEVNINIATMAPKVMKKEIQDRIAELAAKGKLHTVYGYQKYIYKKQQIILLT